MAAEGSESMAMEKLSIADGQEYSSEMYSDRSKNSRIARMVNNKLLSDVTFVVGPDRQRIYAHKLHLVTASQYFYTMFYGSFAEAQLNEIELKDEDPDIFLQILHLIYGAKMELNLGNIRDIFNCMQMYLLPHEYYKPLIDFLMDEIVDEDTAMDIFRENQYYNFRLVDEECMSYIQNNPFYFFECSNFTKLELELMSKIVNLQRINCTDKQLLCALEYWEQANPDIDTTELRKTMSGTVRAYYCYKIDLNCATTVVSSSCLNIDEIFTVELDSTKLVSLYGIGIYIPLKCHRMSIVFGRINDLSERKHELSRFTLEKTTEYSQTVDLMLPEVILEPGKTYKFYFYGSVDKGVFAVDSSCRTVEHQTFKIKFNYPNRKDHFAIAHIWAKFPGCKFDANETLSCCHSKKN